MQHTSVRYLALALGGAVLLLILLLWWRPGNQQTTKAGDTASNGPPPLVNQPDRLRQQLRPGHTYITNLEGSLLVRGLDRDWGIEEVVTINYLFAARIDRIIEQNDGVTLVEKRHFRDVRSLKVNTRLEDLRLRLGDLKGPLLPVLALLGPKASIAAGIATEWLDGASLKQVLQLLPWVGLPTPETWLHAQAVKAQAALDSLAGKSVRITYVDGKG